MNVQSQSLQARLQRRGWRMTAQRRAIAGALQGEDLHLTADEVFQRARRTLPELSLATVYNALTELTALGEVGEIVTGRGPTRYDPNVLTPHHHSVCVECGRLQDVAVPRQLMEALEQAGGTEHFLVDQAQILFRGHCRMCADAPSTAEHP